MEKFSESEQAIIVKALDIPESTPHAICEQIYINGLDAYLSQLAQHNKLEPLAKGAIMSPTILDSRLVPPVVFKVGIDHFFLLGVSSALV